MLPAPPRCECRDKRRLNSLNEVLEATYTGRVWSAAAVIAFANNIAWYIPGSVNMVTFFGQSGIGSVLLEQECTMSLVSSLTFERLTHSRLGRCCPGLVGKSVSSNASPVSSTGIELQ